MVKLLGELGLMVLYYFFFQRRAKMKDTKNYNTFKKPPETLLFSQKRNVLLTGCPD
jgi:hypothetical protein